MSTRSARRDLAEGDDEGWSASGSAMVASVSAAKSSASAARSRLATMSASEAWQNGGRSCAAASRRRSRAAPRRNTSRSARSASPVSPSRSMQARRNAGFHGVGGQARPQRIAIADAVSGQAEIHAEAAAEVGQQMAAADVGEKADADFRHGEYGVFGQHPVRAVEGDADAAAHDDAVDQRDIGLRVGAIVGIEAVFVGEEIDRRRAAPAGLVDVQDVAAGGEGPCPRP